MDELTLAFVRRFMRLRGRMFLAFAMGALPMGWILPCDQLADAATLFGLITGWWVIACAARDRTGPFLSAVLSVSSARKAWYASYMLIGAVSTALICLACLLPGGIRASVGAFLFAFAFGYIVVSIGMFLLLLADHPREMIGFGGMALVLAVVTASPQDRNASWHPFALLKWGLNRALLHAYPSLPSLREPPIWGAFLPLFLALVAWRWSLKRLDRLELSTGTRV